MTFERPLPLHNRVYICSKLTWNFGTIFLGHGSIWFLVSGILGALEEGKGKNKNLFNGIISFT